MTWGRPGTNMPHESRKSTNNTSKTSENGSSKSKDHQRSHIFNTFLMFFEELHGSGNLASLFGFECQVGAITVSPLDRLLIIGTFDQVCFKVKVCPSCCQLLVACKDTLKPSRMQTAVKTHVMHTNMIKQYQTCAYAWLFWSQPSSTFNPSLLGQAAAVKQEIKEELCQEILRYVWRLMPSLHQISC